MCVIFFFHFRGLNVPPHAVVDDLVHSLEDFLPMRSVFHSQNFCLISSFYAADVNQNRGGFKASCFQPVMLNGQ